MAKKPTTLCSAWSYPGCSTLIIPGTIKETRKTALDYFGVSPRDKEFTAKQGHYTNAELKKLPEWNG